PPLLHITRSFTEWFRYLWLHCLKHSRTPFAFDRHNRRHWRSVGCWCRCRNRLDAVGGGTFAHEHVVDQPLAAMTPASYREAAGDRRQLVERVICLRLTEAQLVAGHLRRTIDHLALVIFIPIERNDAICFLHFIPSKCPRIRREDGIGTGVVVAFAVETYSFLEHGAVVAIEAKHEQSEHHNSVGMGLFDQRGKSFRPVHVLMYALQRGA